MNRLYQKLKFLKQDQNGGVLILVAILLVVLMGMAALAVDVGGLYLGRRQAVNAADASALAAALENNDNQAEIAAKEYAELINDVNFEGIEFTDFGSGQSQSNARIITVLVSKQVEFYFARALGFNESDVLAMASVQIGPGNPIAPLSKVGYECFCCVVDPGPDDICSCIAVDNGCNCAEGDCECPNECPDCSQEECVCDELECNECVFGYQGKVWKVRNENGECVKLGERIQLKYRDWSTGEYGGGNFHPIVLPGQQRGAATFRSDLAGGYEGPLSNLDPESEDKPSTDTEPGNMPGPTSSGLEDRLNAVSGGEMCTIESLRASSNPYDCPLLIIIPLMEEPPGPINGRRELNIVGFASFLLEPETNGGFDGNEVWGYLFEYLTYEDLERIFDDHNLVSYLLRLVQDPIGAKNALLDQYHNN